MICLRCVLAVLLLFYCAGTGSIRADEPGATLPVQPVPAARERLGPSVRIGPAVPHTLDQTDDRLSLLRHWIRDGDRILSPGWSDQGHVSGRWLEQSLLRAGEMLLLHLQEPPAPGALFMIYQPGSPLTDPADGTVLGTLAHQVGRVQVTGEQVAGDWHARLLHVQGEVQVGDRLLHDPNMPDTFQRHTQIPAPVVGRVLAVANAMELAGADQVVIVGVGRQDRVSQGLVLSVHHTPASAVDPVTGRKIAGLSSPVGEATLFLIGERASFALLGPASFPVSRGDEVSSR